MLPSPNAQTHALLRRTHPDLLSFPSLLPCRTALFPHVVTRLKSEMPRIDVTQLWPHAMAKESCTVSGKVGAEIVEEAEEIIVGELQLTAHIIALAVSGRMLSVSQDYSVARFEKESRTWSFYMLGGKFDGALRGAMSGAFQTSSWTGDGRYLPVRVGFCSELRSILVWKERV